MPAGTVPIGPGSWVPVTDYRVIQVPIVLFKKNKNVRFADFLIFSLFLFTFFLRLVTVPIAANSADGLRARKQLS